MPEVSFRTAGGQTVSFNAKAKKKRPDSQLTPYQRHVRREFAQAKKESGGSLTMAQSRRVMKMAAQSWRSM